MNKTSISYADLTWNPFLGCSRASTGCEHCYAERLASTRLAHLPAYQGLTANGRWNGTVRMLPERLDEPLRRRKPSVIFVGDMGDLFHPEDPFEFIAAIFGVMAACPQHTFLTLTKRPERMVEFMGWMGRDRGCHPETWAMHSAAGHVAMPKSGSVYRWPLPNWWPGVTVEKQREADRRIPLLLKTPAAHRWVSAEPLLEAIDFDRPRCDCCGELADTVANDGATPWCTEHDNECSYGHWLGREEGIDQLIVGGESGPGARPCDVEWIRSLRDQCAEAGTKFYVKQLGANVVDDAAWGIGKAVCARPGSPMHDPAEWPADLRVRELGWR